MDVTTNNISGDTAVKSVERVIKDYNRDEYEIKHYRDVFKALKFAELINKRENEKLRKYCVKKEKQGHADPCFFFSMIQLKQSSSSYFS